MPATQLLALRAQATRRSRPIQQAGGARSRHAPAAWEEAEAEPSWEARSAWEEAAASCEAASCDATEAKS